MSQAPMSQQDYVTEYGNHCPVCRSENISTQSTNADAGSIGQDVSCDDCDARWEENYNLSGYTLRS